jgi:hypothetical protein
MRTINSLGKANQRILRDHFGYKTITKAMKDFGVETKEEAYELMREQYNAYVEQEQSDKKQTEKDFYKQQVTSRNIYGFEKKPAEEHPLMYLKKELHKYIGKRVVVKYLVDRKIKKEVTSFVESNYSSWWNIYAKHWWIDSRTTIFDEYAKGKILIYPESENLNPKKVLQYFREGITNCLYTPIINVATKRMEEAKSKSCIYRYKKLITDCEELQKKQLETGVPEDFLPELANKLQIDIKIKLPLIDRYIEAKSTKKSVMSFVFTNTRLNHVELNEITYDNNYIEVTKEELSALIHRYDTDNIFYEYTKNNNGVNSVKSIEGNYRISNPLRQAINDFENENNFHQYKLDDVDDMNVSNFIRNGTHYNETIDFIDTTNLQDSYDYIKHIDMKKAYANFYTCKFYKGFLGKVTDFRETDKIIDIGYYYIYDLDFNSANKKFIQYNEKMKIYEEGIYPSPELDMLNYYGVTFKIKCGCWGVNSFDFRFNETMLNTKDEYGSTYYAKCVGMWDCHNLKNPFWYKGSNEHIDIIRAWNINADIKTFGDESALFITKEHSYHLGHITGFITSYQRINVIEQLIEMDYDKLIRICVDGIYTYENDITLCNVFRLKEDLNFNNEPCDTYISRNSFPFEYAKSRQHYVKELFLGAGGCGKTHINLIDKGLIRPLYISPSWKLARNKQDEYKTNVSVWDRLYNDDPEKTNYINRFSNVLIVDEVSMLSNHQKNKIFELYPNCKIIFCGDIGHQLPPIGDEVMETDGFDNIFEYKINRRCKCEKLKHILDMLRIFNTQKKHPNYIRMWIKTQLRMQLYTKEDVINLYNIEDMILVGTNKQKDYYTSLFKGKFSKEKYMIKMNTRLYNNGEIIITDTIPNGCGAVEQHAFTIHSIQGETAKHKLFIDLEHIFDTTMIYTAISRASYIHQIYLIK